MKKFTEFAKFVEFTELMKLNLDSNSLTRQTR